MSSCTCISSDPPLSVEGVGIAQIQVSYAQAQRDLRCLQILKQAYSPEYQRVQCAFKDSMIHWILQFTLRIAFRCVLHRCESQEIRCWKLYLELFIQNIFRQKSFNKGLVLCWRDAWTTMSANIAHKVSTCLKSAVKHLLWMILPQVHLRKPCYDFYFL